MKFEMLNEPHACKLADILPKEEGEVRAIFAKERFVLEPATIEEILEIIRKYL
jgi:DNA-directed RNA polymerase subunit F